MDPFSTIGAIGSVGKGLAGLFGGRKNRNNPSGAAKPYLDQVPSATKPYYQPYINEGRGASTNLNNEYGRMTNDPQSVYDQMGKGYKESQGYQTRLQAALQAAQNASAAGGMLGTPQYQQESAQIANDMSSKDYEDYLNHMLGIYGGGIQGQENTAGRGYDASKGYAGILSNNLGDQATNAYYGQAGKNRSNQDNWGNIISGLGGLSWGNNNGSDGSSGFNWKRFFGGE